MSGRPAAADTDCEEAGALSELSRLVALWGDNTDNHDVIEQVRALWPELAAALDAMVFQEMQ